MIAIAGETKRRWAAAVATAAGLAVAGVMLFRAPPVSLSDTLPPARTVELRKVTADQNILSEEALLHDLAPLFLPTERNATLRRLPVREPGQSFLNIETPKLGIADAAWRFDRDLPPMITLNDQPLSAASPLDYLQAAAADASATGFGRTEQQVPALRERGGFVEIVRERDGQRVLSQALATDVRPPTEKMWQPFVFLATVGPAGLVSPPTLSSGSGVEEVDAFFRNYLVRTLLIGELLTPGLYRITIAP